MEITKEQIKRLAKAVKAMQEETLIDDDVSGGYQPDPFKDAYAEIYKIIDECERGLNVDAGENTLPVVMQRSELLLFADYYESDKTSQTTDEVVDNYLAGKRILEDSKRA